MITAGQISWFYSYVGRKKALILGTVLCLISMLVVYILKADFNWVIYYVAGFVGCSQAFVLSTGINLIS